MTTARMATATTPARAPRSLIPWLFVAAMALVLVVNGVMVTIAIDSFTGLAVSAPYKQGLAYNRVLAAQAQQDALGWRLELARSPQGDLVLLARDAAGDALEDLRLTAQLVRPVEPLPAVAVVFTAEGGGRYRAAIDVPRSGQWDVQLDAVNPAGRFYLRQRIFVP